MSSQTQDTFGATPTHQATTIGDLPNTARDGINVTDDTASASHTIPSLTSTLDAKPPLSGQVRAYGQIHEVEQQHVAVPAVHKTVVQETVTPVAAPAADDGAVARITSGLGGMLMTGPLAALEKVSPSLAHGVETAASALGDMVHSLTGTGPQYSDTTQLSDAAQVKSAVETTAQKVHETVKPTLEAATQTLQANAPQTLGGQAAPATQQFAQPTTNTRETGSVSSIEPAGVRKQVQPVSNIAVPPSTTSTTTPAPLVTGADVHAYVETAKEKVREVGEIIADMLPGPEKQKQMTDTAARSLERVPDIASSAASSTIGGLTVAANTTAQVAGPAVTYTANAATNAAHAVVDAAQQAASQAQQAASQVHLPGWSAPVPDEGVHSGSATTRSGPMGGTTAPGDEAALFKEMRDKEFAQGQGAQSSSRGLDAAKGLDLGKTHNEPALDQQVSTHNPDDALTKHHDEPALTRQAGLLSHRDSDYSPLSTPGTATILSRESIGGPSFAPATGSTSSGPYSQTPGAGPYHGIGAVESAGFERFGPTASQSAGGHEQRTEGVTSNFMPHSDSSAPAYGASSSSKPRSPGREDTHTPSHVDTSHHDGQPLVCGAGARHTHSSTHTNEPSSTRGATTDFSSAAETRQHSAFVPDNESSSTAHAHAHGDQSIGFEAFETGQPLVGASPYGGTARTSAQHGVSTGARDEGLQSAQHGRASDSQRDSSVGSKIETAAAEVNPASSTFTSASQQHGSNVQRDFGGPTTEFANTTSPASTTQDTGLSRTSAQDSSLADKAERVTQSDSTHSSQPQQSYGASSATGSTQQSHWPSPSTDHSHDASHKPSIKERLKETFHHKH